MRRAYLVIDVLVFFFFISLFWDATVYEDYFLACVIGFFTALLMEPTRRYLKHCPYE